MRNQEKAEIILEAMEEEGLVINWNCESHYINAVVKGLEKIQRLEEDNNGSKRV